MVLMETHRQGKILKNITKYIVGEDESYPIQIVALSFSYITEI